MKKITENHLPASRVKYVITFYNVRYSVEQIYSIHFVQPFARVCVHIRILLLENNLIQVMFNKLSMTIFRDSQLWSKTKHIEHKSSRVNRD